MAGDISTNHAKPVFKFVFITIYNDIVANDSISIDTSISIVNITQVIFQWLLLGTNGLATNVGI